MAPDPIDILFVVIGLFGVAVLVSAERRAWNPQAAPHRISLTRQRVGGAGAVSIGLLGALFLVDRYGPEAWHGVLFALMVAVLVALLGLVVASLVLAFRAERTGGSPSDRVDVHL